MRAGLEREASFGNPRFPDQHDNGRPVLAESGVDGFLNCFEFRRPARKPGEQRRKPREQTVGVARVEAVDDEGHDRSASGGGHEQRGLGVKQRLELPQRAQPAGTLEVRPHGS